MRRVLALLAVLALVAVPGHASAQETPTVTVDPATGEAGDLITVVVDGFQPGTVEILIDDVDSAPLGSRTIGSGAAGFTIRVRIPRGLTVGGHTVIACRDRDRATCREQAVAKLVVTAPPPTTTSSTTTTSTTTTTTPRVTTTTTTTRPPTTTAPPTTTSDPPPPSTGVVVTTTTQPGDLQATTTLPPTTAPPTTVPDAIVTSTTVGGDPVPPPSSSPTGLGVTTTTTQPDEGAFPSAVADIELLAIEVTQGLQNLANDFPLLAGRPTWVRVHAITHDPSGVQPNVDAGILVLRNGVEQGVLFAENAPVTLPGEFSADSRATHDGVTYFEIPADWTQAGGTLEVRAVAFAHGVADASNEADPDNNSGAVTVFLDEAEPATIHYFPIYMEDDAGEPLVHFASMGLLHEHLQVYRTWPIAQLTMVAHSTIVGDAESDWDLSESGDSSGPNLALAELYAESGLDGTHQYAGMVHADVETHFGGYATAGTTWSKMGLGYDNGVHSWRQISGEVVAHEGGHWAGLAHAPCSWTGEDLPGEVHGGAYDPTFPATYSWPNCSLAPTDPAGYYGFDPMPSAPGTDHPAIMSNEPLADTAAFPFMGYVNPGWTDPYHGCKMLVFLGVACAVDQVTPTDPGQGNGGAVPGSAAGGVAAFDCDLDLPGDDADFCDLQLGPDGDPTAAPPAAPQQLIVGLVDPVDGEYRLDRAVGLATRSEVDGRLTGDPANDGPYVVALVDDTGAVQWATTVETDDPSAHGAGVEDQASSPFAVRFPTFPDTARIVLARPGEVLAELTPGAAPEVTITDATVGDDGLHVDLAIDDPDGPAHWTSVQYRPHPSAPWVMLAAGSDATSFRFEDLGDLPASDDGEILVRVTDGFTTVDAARTGLVVPDQPPTVTILSPLADAAVTTTDALRLEAHGIDADAGFDPAALSYAWESDLDGPLGTGHATVGRDLRPGDHTITVRVTDGGGNTVERSVAVTVHTATEIDPAVVASVTDVLRGSVRVLGPFTVDLGAPTTGGAGGCDVCVPLGLGIASAFLLAALTWRWTRPAVEVVPVD